MASAEIATKYPASLGVRADTGLPLPGFDPVTLNALLQAVPPPGPKDAILSGRAAPGDLMFPVTGDVNVNDLGEAGWGVIFAADVGPEVKAALEPLLALRRSQTVIFRVFEGADAPRGGENAFNWLARHGVAMRAVDPALGVPLYLLLVGSPDEISFEFQYELDIYFGVGRLHFDTVEEYSRYAQSVVTCETAIRPPTTRQAALFATTHALDPATQLFTSHVARPLADGLAHQPPLGKRQKFALRPFIGEDATKESLRTIFSGNLPGGAPSLLFSGTHGMEFDLDDPRLRETQGALVCQDWKRGGVIGEDDWFAARDVPADAHVHGLVHMFFSSHGAGCSKFDNFQRLAGSPRQTAPAAFIARLPQALLAHPNGGALAVIAQVGRAWASGFVSETSGAQTQGFRDVMGRLLRGERAGQATDQLSLRWAALSTELAELLASRAHGADVPDAQLANLWVARDDARNYIIFGDPAVRLRVEDMPEL